MLLPSDKNAKYRTCTYSSKRKKCLKINVHSKHVVHVDYTVIQKEVKYYVCYFSAILIYHVAKCFSKLVVVNNVRQQTMNLSCPQLHNAEIQHNPAHCPKTPNHPGCPYLH